MRAQNGERRIGGETYILRQSFSAFEDGKEKAQKIAKELRKSGVRTRVRNRDQYDYSRIDVYAHIGDWFNE